MLGRYKFIVMHLRKNNALEHRNIFATGGGLSTLSEEKTPFEITGPFLELRNVLGISITGLSGFGSDSQTLDTSIEAPVTGQIDEPGSIYSFEDTVTDHWTELVEDPEDSLPKTVQVESELAVGEVVVNSEIELVPPANLSVSVASISATPIPSRSQYFPTQTQHQKCKRKIAAVSDANVECRKQEKHAAVMKYDAMLMEAKIKELREKEMDRQLERERSAELHKLELDRRAMMIHHEETLFSLKKDVLLAQRDAFARVSPQNVMLLPTQIDGLNMTPIRAAELINTVGGSEKHTE